MKNTLILIIQLLISFSGFTQNLTEKEFVVLTFESSSNKGQHKNIIYSYYWIAELEKYEKVDEYKEPKIYSLFLNEFFGSDQLETCCSGKVSYPFIMTTETEFKFPENYSEYLTGLRKLVKDNRKQIQVINKKWKNNYKEKVTVYATAVKGKICVCEYGGKIILKAGDLISFPKGEFRIIDDYWNDNKNILLFKDFSTFEYENIL
ncbi:MAG: hypothetical protein WDZ45_03800 [Flavobacteriaceae bacterium]